MRQKPLKLDCKYPWCNQLKSIVEKNERLTGEARELEKRLDKYRKVKKDGTG